MVPVNFLPPETFGPSNEGRWNVVVELHVLVLVLLSPLPWETSSLDAPNLMSLDVEYDDLQLPGEAFKSCLDIAKQVHFALG